LPTIWRTSDSLCADPGGDRGRIQTLAAELSRRLSRYCSKPKRMKAVQHEGTNHQVAIAAFLLLAFTFNRINRQFREH
jgi:hypothetical protein